MVDTQLRRRGIDDARVLAAFERVPRHDFTGDADLRRCYGDHPLPIDCAQTISQPYVVAYALQAAEVAAGDRVLEIGAGSGYQTALLAELAADVRSLEFHAPLAALARGRLADLGYGNVEIRVGDGGNGWPDGGHFDAIVGSAAAPEIPPPLLEQLAPGGRLVMPVGVGFEQQLVLARRREAGTDLRPLLPVRFVPLLRG